MATSAPAGRRGGASIGARCGFAPPRRSRRRRQIVDVPWVRLWPGGDAKIEACSSEQLWSVTLPSAFADDHAVWHVRASL